MKKLLLLLFLIPTISLAGKYYGQQPTETKEAVSQELIVKKSRSNICHAPYTTYYSRTKYFTPFKSLDDCIKSGGRLPKR